MSITKRRPLKKYGNLTRAQQKLVTDNLWIVGRLVYKIKILKRGYTGILSHDDLTQVGHFGMCVAARKYDSSRSVKFSTFAWNYVQGYISHALRDRSRLVRLPRWVPKLRGEIRELKEKGLEYDEISEILDVDQKKIFECENSYGELHVSIDVMSKDDGSTFSTHAVYQEPLSDFQYPDEFLERASRYSDRQINKVTKFIYGELEPDQQIIDIMYDLMDIASIVWKVERKEPFL